MKKIIYLSLAVLVTAVFMGCADDSKSNATQDGQSSTSQPIDGIVIEPVPANNVITLQPTSDGKYVLTLTNGTLVNGNATPESSDIFFQFDLDLNGINEYDGSFALIDSETTCPGERTLFYKRLDKHPDRRSCKITYKINGPKKDIYMKKFIVIKNPNPNHTFNENNTQGETITIKHQ